LGGELLVELKKYVFKEAITNGHHYIRALIDGLTSNPPAKKNPGLNRDLI